MTVKRGFLTPRRNSSSVSCYYFYWIDLFFSAAAAAAGGKSTCLISHSLAAGCLSCKQQHMLNTPTEHMMNFKLITHRKWLYNIFQLLVWEMRLFLQVQENIPGPRTVLNLIIKFEFKGILVFFLLSLILLQPSMDKRRQVNGVRRRKRCLIQNSEHPNTNQLLTATMNKTSHIPLIFLKQNQLWI